MQPDDKNICISAPQSRGKRKNISLPYEMIHVWGKPTNSNTLTSILNNILGRWIKYYFTQVRLNIVFLLLLTTATLAYKPFKIIYVFRNVYLIFHFFKDILMHRLSPVNCRECQNLSLKFLLLARRDEVLS